MAYAVEHGLEPLYTLDVAAELIPFPTKHALSLWLHRNKQAFPARYRRTHQPGQFLGTVPQRLLTHSELVLIRSLQLKEYDLSNRGRKPGPVRNGNRYEFKQGARPVRHKQTVAGPLAGIIRRAMASEE